MLQAARQLAPAGLDLILYEGLATLPLFNSDGQIERLPASVLALRAAVGASDAVLIACPEYAHGVPGAFAGLVGRQPGVSGQAGSLVECVRPRFAPRARRVARDPSLHVAQLLDAACATVPLSGAGCDVVAIPRDEARCAELHAVLVALATELSGG